MADTEDLTESKTTEDQEPRPPSSSATSQKTTGDVPSASEGDRPESEENPRVVRSSHGHPSRSTAARVSRLELLGAAEEAEGVGDVPQLELVQQHFASVEDSGNVEDWCGNDDVRWAVAELLQSKTFILNPKGLVSDLSRWQIPEDEVEQALSSAPRLEIKNGAARRMSLLWQAETKPSTDNSEGSESGSGSGPDLQVLWLVERARQDVKRIFREVRETLLTVHNTLPEAFEKMDATGNQEIDLTEFLDGMSSAWSSNNSTNQAKRTKKQWEHVFKLLAGRPDLAGTITLHDFTLRLSGLDRGTLRKYRNALIARYKGIRAAYDAMATKKEGSSDVTVTETDFEDTYVSLMCPDDASPEQIARTRDQALALFELMDSGKGDSDSRLSLDELQMTLSDVAPSKGLEDFRRSLLLMFGSWQNAFAQVQTKGNNLTVYGQLVRCAGLFDINIVDLQKIFEGVLPDVERRHIELSTFTEQFKNGGNGISMSEFSLRMWLGKNEGKQMSEIFAKNPIDFDRNLLRADFAAELFDLRHGKEAMPSEKLKVLPVFPKMTEMEVNKLFDEVRIRCGKVTLNVIAGMVGSNVSDILATSETSFSPGENAVIRYRIPRELGKEMLEKPFIAMVPAEMKWSSGGGGGWRLRGTPVADVPGPKVQLVNKREGVVLLTIPMGHELFERQEFRLFASPNGRKIGKQIGGGVSFEVCPARPGQPIVDRIMHRSIRMTWEPPPGDFSDAVVEDYCVKVQPQQTAYEENTQKSQYFKSLTVWNHDRQGLRQICSYDLQGLHPGLTYRCVVVPLHRSQDQKTYEGTESQPSAPITTQSCISPTEPGAPQIQNVSPAEVELTWAPPNSDGGGAVTLYRVYRCEAEMFKLMKGGGLGSLKLSNVDPTQSSHFFASQKKKDSAKEGLQLVENALFTSAKGGIIRCVAKIPTDVTSTKQWHFFCTAVNAAGEGPISPPSKEVPLRPTGSPPGPPTRPEVVSDASNVTADHNVLELKFNAPKIDGGYPLTGYCLLMKRIPGEVDEGDQNSDLVALGEEFEVQPAWSSISDNNVRCLLRKGVELPSQGKYVARVQAINLLGKGTPSDESAPLEFEEATLIDELRADPEGLCKLEEFIRAQGGIQAFNEYLASLSVQQKTEELGATTGEQAQESKLESQNADTNSSNHDKDLSKEESKTEDAEVAKQETSGSSDISKTTETKQATLDKADADEALEKLIVEFIEPAGGSQALLQALASSGHSLAPSDSRALCDALQREGGLQGLLVSLDTPKEEQSRKHEQQASDTKETDELAASRTSGGADEANQYGGNEKLMKLVLQAGGPEAFLASLEQDRKANVLPETSQSNSHKGDDIPQDKEELKSHGNAEDKEPSPADSQAADESSSKASKETAKVAKGAIATDGFEEERAAEVYEQLIDAAQRAGGLAPALTLLDAAATAGGADVYMQKLHAKDNSSGESQSSSPGQQEKQIVSEKTSDQENQKQVSGPQTNDAQAQPIDDVPKSSSPAKNTNTDRNSKEQSREREQQASDTKETGKLAASRTSGGTDEAKQYGGSEKLMKLVLEAGGPEAFLASLEQDRKAIPPPKNLSKNKAGRSGPQPNSVGKNGDMPAGGDDSVDETGNDSDVLDADTSPATGEATSPGQTASGSKDDLGNFWQLVAKAGGQDDIVRLLERAIDLGGAEALVLSLHPSTIESKERSEETTVPSQTPKADPEKAATDKRDQEILQKIRKAGCLSDLLRIVESKQAGLKDFKGINLTLASVQQYGGDDKFLNFLEAASMAGRPEDVLKVLNAAKEAGGAEKLIDGLGDVPLERFVKIMEVFKSQGLPPRPDTPALDEERLRREKLSELMAEFGGTDVFIRLTQGADLSVLREVIRAAALLGGIARTDPPEKSPAAAPLPHLLRSTLEAGGVQLVQELLDTTAQLWQPESNKEQAGTEDSDVPKTSNSSSTEPLPGPEDSRPASGQKDRRDPQSKELATEIATRILSMVNQVGGSDAFFEAIHGIPPSKFITAMSVMRASRIVDLCKESNEAILVHSALRVRLWHQLDAVGGVESFLRQSEKLDLGLLPTVVELVVNMGLGLGGSVGVSKQQVAKCWDRIVKEVVDGGGIEDFMKNLDHNNVFNLVARLPVLVPAEVPRDALSETVLDECFSTIAATGGAHRFLEATRPFESTLLTEVLSAAKAMRIATAGSTKEEAKHISSQWKGLANHIQEHGGLANCATRYLESDRVLNWKSTFTLLSALRLVDGGDASAASRRAEEFANIIPMVDKAGGPDKFLASIEGISLQHIVALAKSFKAAGLLSDDDDMQSDRNVEKIKEFLSYVQEACGFDTFLWGLHGIELSHLQQNMHTLSVIKESMHKAASEASWAWRVLEDHQLLSRLFAKIQACGGIDEYLNAVDYLDQIVAVVEPLGGCQAFLKTFGNLELITLLRDSGLLNSNVGHNGQSAARMLGEALQQFGGVDAFVYALPREWAVLQTLRKADHNAELEDWKLLGDALKELGGVIEVLAILSNVHERSPPPSPDHPAQLETTPKPPTPNLVSDSRINSKAAPLQKTHSVVKVQSSAVTLGSDDISEGKDLFGQSPGHQRPQTMEAYGSFQKVPTDHCWEETAIEKLSGRKRAVGRDKFTSTATAGGKSPQKDVQEGPLVLIPPLPTVIQFISEKKTLPLPVVNPDRKKVKKSEKGLHRRLPGGDRAPQRQAWVLS